jgi:hypothetical protein
VEVLWRGCKCGTGAAVVMDRGLRGARVAADAALTGLLDAEGLKRWRALA